MIDGSVGLSAIGQWKHVPGDAGDPLIIHVVYGQNALNLAKVGKGGTLMVTFDVLSIEATQGLRF